MIEVEEVETRDPQQSARKEDGDFPVHSRGPRPPRRGLAVDYMPCDFSSVALDYVFD